MKLVKITALWCLSCIFMNEILREIENENTLKVEKIELDFDDNQNEIKKYNIGTTLPVYILLNENNEEIIRSVGEKNKKELTKFFLENGVL